ncbi:molybdopterin molybdotransferase MoeA [Nocardiopsis ansamitocini]|nr:molybdopterin molybdotransferase MoeA [Nocardiopsis ansamitocini]
MPWAAARRAARELGARSGPVPAVREPLAAALDAALADDLIARIPLPPFDASAMDGYAVCGPGPWALRGQILAGRPSDIDLRPGEAAEIATGARVPTGTTAVLPYERSEVRDASLHGAIESGRHVRWRGEELAEGSVVLPAGQTVTPAVLGLAASLAHDDLAVRRPRVAAFVSGDELVDDGVPAVGAVRDAIGPMLEGLVRWGGGTLASRERIGDGFAAMVSALGGAAGASVVVVCGASSAGPADHLRGALAELGASVVVDGVRCRPGHPQLLGHLGPPSAPGTLVVGLPGNPNAALVAALTLLVPLLRALAGRPPADPGLAAGCLVEGDVRPHERDTRLVAVRVEQGRARPVGHDGPAVLRGAALADAFAVIPPDWRGPDARLMWLPR